MVRGFNVGPILNSLGPHPNPLTTVTWLFPGANPPARGVDHPSPLAPNLKKEYSYTSTPLWDSVACARMHFAFTFTFIFNAISSQNFTSKFFPIYNLLIKLSLEAANSTQTDSIPQQPTRRKLIC